MSTDERARQHQFHLEQSARRPRLRGPRAKKRRRTLEEVYGLGTPEKRATFAAKIRAGLEALERAEPLIERLRG